MSGVAGAHRSTVDFLPVTDNEIQEGQPGIAKAALFGLCPKCGAKTMFSGPTKFAGSCGSCNLDFNGFNVGDGPAVFLTMGVGALIIIMALLFDTAVRPPFWVHALIWIPVTVAMVIGALRFTKGALLASEYRNHAGEGKL
jgi:uncharacterized protein (DUF983 family)